MKNIADIPQLDRPREKLLSRGKESLSDVELLAVILGRGTKNRDVLSMAKDLLGVLNVKNGSLCCDDIMNIHGFGEARVAQVMAALEFSRRRIKPEGVKIAKASDAVPLFSPYANSKQEHFICVSLNGANEVINLRLVTVGLLNRTQVHPREVYADAITDRAAAIIVAHNHPSGELKPSSQDITATETLRKSGELLGITLLDHIIFNLRGYFSFQESGMLK
jgi:DNA repair protein RadC